MNRTGITGLLVLLLAGGACTIPQRPGTDAYDVILKDNPFIPKDNHVPSETDAPAFLVTVVEPDRGPVNGGTRVEISGIGLIPGSTVIFGASEGVEVVVQNEGSILAGTPPGQPGPVNVSVVRPDGKTAFLENGFFYDADIIVTDVEPDSGPTSGGTPIRINGNGFQPDSTVVVDGRLAVTWHLLDEETLLAVTPPGSAGPRDVTVFNSLGSTTAKRAFEYLSPPSIISCDPAVVLVGQAIEMVVKGSHLSHATSVLSTNGTPVFLESPASNSVRLSMIPVAKGPIDLSLLTPGGKATLPGCAFALDPLESPGVPRVHGIVPSTGSSAGGYSGKVVVSGFQPDWTTNQVSVQLGGTSATVLAVWPDESYVEVQVPAHEPSLVPCSLQTPGGNDILGQAFEYLPEVAMDSLEPSSGPPSGGTDVTILGQHLEQVVEVAIGPLPATIIAGPSPASILVRTAPANPGIHDVTLVTAWNEQVVYEDAFIFGADEPALYTVTPGSGSQAGGTLVSVVGSGFSDSVTVRIGDDSAEVLDATDPARLLVYTPPGTPGREDVSVIWPDGTTRVLHQAFTYFDPTGFFGGVWGDVVNGAVNVTVLDSYNGKPVQGAFVMLGKDAETDYRGITDIRGQLTLSGKDVTGPVQVTASRPDYSTFTLSGSDAENITIFLDPVIPTSSGSGGSSAQPLPNGLVSGRVLGADKYLLAPPASCEDRPLIHGKLCEPCIDDDDCGPAAHCLNPAGTGHFCATDCAVEGDCPLTYDCYGLGSGGTACLPSPGKVEIRCGTSVRNIFSYEEDPGPGYMADEDGIYALNARLGDIAVYCIGGLRRWEDGQFDPVAMGLLRHVSVYPAQITSDQDIWLDIPLDRDLTVRLLNAPGGPGGPNVHEARISLDLGSDGTLRLWPDQQGLDRNRFVFHDLPRYFVAGLEESILYIHGEAGSQTPNGVPYSASVERDWIPGEAPRVARISGDFVELLDPYTRPDATGGCGLPEGGGIVFSPFGRTWGIDPYGEVTQMPSMATRTLRACQFLPGGDLLAVGDFGTIIRYDGFIAEQEVISSARQLLDVAVAPDGTEFVVGDGVLLQRAPGFEWQFLDYGSKAPLYSVVTAPDSSALAVGAGGVTVRIRDGKTSLLTPNPTSEDLFDATTYGWGVLLVGAGGTAILGGFDGGFLPVPAPVSSDLLVVAGQDDGSVLAAGAVGSILRFQDGEWSALGPPDFEGEVTTLVPGADGSTLALSGDVAVIGPFLYLPEFLSPHEGALWTDRVLAWTRDAPPAPSLTYTRLYGPKSAREWTVMADGPIETIPLPDLSLAAAPYMELSPLPDGEIRLHSIQMLIDHFNFNAFDSNVFSMSSWRSWTIEEFNFLKP